MSGVADPTSSKGAQTASGAAERAARARALVDAAKQATKTLDERRQQERSRDESLVARAKAGDTACFQQLVVAHQGRLFSVAFGMLRDRDDAMDVVQDAFIKAHRKLADFEGNAAFSTWLHRIAVNLCIDRKRADARRRTTALDDAASHNFEDDPLYGEAEYAPKLSGANPLRNVGDKQLGEQIGRGLAQLSDDHRAIVLLREVEGMSYEEIAATLGIPRGTVMSRLFHARKNLQRALRPLLGIEDGMGLDGKPMEGEAARAVDDGTDPGGREERGPGRRRTRESPPSLAEATTPSQETRS
jgi:RNA polymerase sigma-70 factor (ECF subfamily)